jgi:hypothetical protein
MSNIKIEIDLEDFLVDHLKMWKDSGVPAPVNELQSIATWLRESSYGLEQMQNKMRQRMLLLMKTANALDKQHGIDGAVLAGIYANRPDLELEARLALAKVTGK